MDIVPNIGDGAKLIPLSTGVLSGQFRAPINEYVIAQQEFIATRPAGHLKYFIPLEVSNLLNAEGNTSSWSCDAILMREIALKKGFYKYHRTCHIIMASVVGNDTEINTVL